MFNLLSTLLVYAASLMRICTGDDQSCSSVFSCVNCTALRVCMPNSGGTGFTELTELNCSGPSPYCNKATGSCQPMPTLDCAVIGDEECLDDGTFPHPTDCTKYFVCIDLISYTFQCRQNYLYYGPDGYQCTWTTCETFNCNNGNGMKVPYPHDAAVFAFCINGVATLVDRCPGRDELNTTSQNCEPVCRHEGLIPDTKNSSNYYRCTSISGNQYSMTKLSCPTGELYNESEFQCVATTDSKKKHMHALDFEFPTTTSLQ